MKSFLEGYRNLCESAQTREWRKHAEMAGLALECLSRRAADEGAVVVVERWFSYSMEGDGFELHNTEDAARSKAEKELSIERDAADEGWGEFVDSICWGRLYGKVDEVERRPTTEDDANASQFDEIVDYGLIDLIRRRSAEPAGGEG
jgi:hypothetical protein